MNKYFVLGNPIKHSKSPQIHRLFAQQTQQNIHYDKLEIPIDQFSEQLQELINKGMNGCNVTVPFKQNAWKFAHQLSDGATLAEAVNTLVCEKDGTVTGHNTDGIGLVRDLIKNHQIQLKDARILIAGAGGAARGILQPILAEAPENIVISNRTHSKAEDLANIFNHLGSITTLKYSALGSQPFDIIINATSSSLEATIPPIPENCISQHTTLYDLMYSSAATSFLIWGKKCGAAKTFDGLGMLVEQAAESFYLWRGIRPETAKVIASFQEST